MPLLSIENLTIRFRTEGGLVQAVDDVSLTLEEGKTLCLVGESGCGKSVTSMSILRLIQCPPGEIVGGSINFRDKDLLKVPPTEIKNIRGREIGVIFQDTMTSLNPVFTCGFQIEEGLRHHLGLSAAAAKQRAIELLRQVQIPDPERRYAEYPHQLSGGMRQRVMIAMALSCDPRLLIADEPTTALDVTVQAQILQLLATMKAERNMAMLFITHDLGIVAEIADHIVVLYAGKVAERGTAEDIFERAKHPYTLGLLDSMPHRQLAAQKLRVIPGTLPDPTAFTKGCRFYDRCERRLERCAQEQPPEFDLGGSHRAACFNMR